MKILSNGNLRVVVFDEKKKKAFEKHGFKEIEKPKPKRAEEEKKGEE